MGCGASISDAPPPPALGPDDVGQDFVSSVELGDRLQSDGGFRLHRGVRKESGESCLVKVCSKTEVGTLGRFLGQADVGALTASLEERIKREMAVLKSMAHPSLCNWIGAFEDATCFYLVTECLPGTDLYCRVCQGDTRLPELQTIESLSQLLDAVSFLHSRNICHRDLRPENVLTGSASGTDLFDVKLTGFHCARYFGNDEVLETKCGAPFYVAPQVLVRQYNHLCDIWSIGVMTYVMVAAYPPFFGGNDVEILQKVAAGKFSFNRSDWESFSEEAKNMCRMCLKMDPEMRATAKKAKHHVETVWRTAVSA